MAVRQATRRAYATCRHEHGVHAQRCAGYFQKSRDRETRAATHGHRSNRTLTPSAAKVPAYSAPIPRAPTTAMALGSVPILRISSESWTRGCSNGNSGGRGLCRFAVALPCAGAPGQRRLHGRALVQDSVGGLTALRRFASKYRAPLAASGPCQFRERTTCPSLWRDNR